MVPLGGAGEARGAGRGAPAGARMEKLPAGGKLFFVYLLACLVCLFFLPCLLASIFTDTYSPQKQVQKPGTKEEEGVSLKNIFT